LSALFRLHIIQCSTIELSRIIQLKAMGFSHTLKTEH